MRDLADADRIRRFMRAIARAADSPGRVYFTGGATAVLHGWRASTIDIDVRLEPEQDSVLRAIAKLKDELSVNVELAAPIDFIPVPEGWGERSVFVAQEGPLTFLHFDLYAQALAKIERGHAQDLDDVRTMLDRGLVDRAGLRDYFERVKPLLYSTPPSIPAGSSAPSMPRSAEPRVLFARQPRRPRPRSGRRRWVRRTTRLLLLLFALPHLLLLVYRVVPPPLTSLMLIRLVEGQGLSKDWVGRDRIAPVLPEAAIAAEDNRFCGHHGVDWSAMQTALDEYRSEDRVRGASTITMQTVKNLVLWPGRDPVRKALEIYFAYYVELIWPKRRIMEVYLNVAEWGPGLYGAEAASRRYFDKPARQLTTRDASLLAAVLPSPQRWRPDRPTAYIENRAETIEQRRAQLGPLLACAR